MVLKKNEDVKIAILEVTMGNMGTQMDRMEKKLEKILDSLDNLYVKRAEHDEIKAQVHVLWDWRFKIMAWAFLGGIIGSIVLRIIPFEGIFG